MLIGVLGDIHGDFDITRHIMVTHENIRWWLCVGDVANQNYEYFHPDKPLYWISGNNENWDIIEQLDNREIVIPNFYHIRNGVCVEIDNVRIVGLGGSFAPKFYMYKREDLPHPKDRDFERSDRRRHFVFEDVQKCKSTKNVDILLTHEAPSPFYVKGKIDAGKRCINEILKEVKPKLHFFGHHHQYYVRQYIQKQNTTSICLDRVNVSWILVDTHTYEIKRIFKGFEW